MDCLTVLMFTVYAGTRISNVTPPVTSIAAIIRGCSYNNRLFLTLTG